MPIDRRSFVAGAVLASTVLASSPARSAERAPNPILYRVRQGTGLVQFIGYSDATDNAWFVPKLAAALDAADVLWLETPPGSAAAAAEGEAAVPPPDPELQRLFSEDAYDRSRDLFDVLPDEVSHRTRDWAERLGLPAESLSPMRAWFARITLQQAYAARKQASALPGERLVSPERIVVERARQRGIPIESEYPTLTHLIRFFANLPGPAQPQYLLELLDYVDRDSAGATDAGRFGWISGEPSEHTLDMQRERTPDLYQAMHIERNAWWTGRIEGLLAEGRSAFLMLGQNHTLGPDGIPANLVRRGLALERL